MLIYSLDRYVPTDINMMVIRGKNNTGYFYIHRSLYDQAVVLYDIYKENFSALVQELFGSPNTRADADRFHEEVPAPLNIFAPFLMFVKEELEELEDMVGAIHVMSGPSNLRGLVAVDKNIRNIPSFSLSIKEEYQLAWDRFFQTAMPFSMDMYRPQGIQPMNGVQTTTVDSGAPQTEEEAMDEALDFLFSDDDPFAELDTMFETPAEETKEEKPVAPAPAPVAPAPEPVPVAPAPAPEPAPKKALSGIDALVGGDL